MDDSPKTNFLNNLLIVVVIYKMKIAESPAYQSLTVSLSSQGNPVSLFIYDNSPQVQDLKIDQCWAPNYTHNPANAGVSKAYNEGFKKAKELNKKWLMLADQDTVFSTDIFEKYADGVARYQSQELFSLVMKSPVATISPFRFVLGRGVAIAVVNSGLYSLQDFKFINSGLLVTVSLYGRCGGYDERFPLDFSDIVFAERIKNFVNEFVVIDAVCRHSLSSQANTFQEAVNRFGRFTIASKAYGQLRGMSLVLFVNRLLRSIKLSYRFRSFVFLKIIFG